MSIGRCGGPFSRHIRSTGTDWEGRYHLGPLPPGQYLLVAVDDFEETEIYERETLNQISATAVRLILVPGAMRAQDLRVGGQDDIAASRRRLP